MAYEDLTQKKNELEKLPPLEADVAEELRKTVDLELTSVGDCFDGGALSLLRPFSSRRRRASSALSPSVPLFTARSTSSFFSR